VILEGAREGSRAPIGLGRADDRYLRRAGAGWTAAGRARVGAGRTKGARYTRRLCTSLVDRGAQVVPVRDGAGSPTS